MTKVKASLRKAGRASVVAPVTNAGPLPDGIPGTGRKVTIPGATFAEFDGDKVRWESLTSASEPGMKPGNLLSDVFGLIFG
jgi:hypothetical protein